MLHPHYPYRYGPSSPRGEGAALLEEDDGAEAAAANGHHAAGEAAGAEEGDDGKGPEILLHCVGPATFNARIWIFQFALHLFEPWSTVAYVAAYGTRQADNQFLIPWRIFGEKTSVLQVLRMWFFGISGFDVVLMQLVLFVYLSWWHELHSQGLDLVEAFVFPFLLIMVHRAMVALKYSMLTENEYQQFMNAPTDVARRWNVQIQLLTGWLMLPDSVLKAELHSAADLCGVCVGDYSFVHYIFDDATYEEWMLFSATQDDASLSNTERDGKALDWGRGDPSRETRKYCRRMIFDKAKMPMSPHAALENGLDVGEQRELPCECIMRRLLRLSSNLAISIPWSWAYILAMPVVAIPKVFRYLDRAEECHEGGVLACMALVVCGHPTAAFCSVMAALVTLKYFVLVLQFLSTGTAHFYRNYLLLTWLSRMVRPSRASFPNMPLLQLSSDCGETNLRAFMACFEVLLCFGGRYKSRVEAYVGTVLGTAMISIVSIFLYVMLSGGQGLTQTLRMSALLAMYTSVLALVMVFVMFWVGHSSNDAFKIMVNHLHKARYRRTGGFRTNKQCARQRVRPPQLPDELFSIACDHIDSIMEAQPVTIAGLKASTDTGYTLISLAGSMMFVIVGKLFLPDIL